MPESILKTENGLICKQQLQAGDILTVRIQEETSSPNIPAVNLPIDIVYEDEDIIVINKAAGMPIHLLLTTIETLCKRADVVLLN